MALVKKYKTYPIHRDRDFGFHIEVEGPAPGGARKTIGPFDTLVEAEQEVDELLRREREKFMGAPSGETTR